MSGVPWDDKSGERLRDWISLSADTFYDEDKIAIMPMGLCYPGRSPNGADLPPRTECAPQWHDQILSDMPQVELTLLVGSCAQNYYLGKRAAKTMTETIRLWKNFGLGTVPTPHPSGGVMFWLKNPPWFEGDVLPYLKTRVHRLI